MSAPASVENPYAGQGSVLLDIGGEVGALVVTMPAAMEGVEIELDRASGDDHGHHGGHGGHGGHRPHVAVVNRPVADGQVPSLVFPELVEGRYGLCLKGSSDVVLAVEVHGGEVAAAVWPT
jgi:hypothetical protein